MSVQLVQIFVREDVNAPWWHDSFPSGHLEHFQEHYIGPGIYTGTRELLDEGKMLVVTHTLSDQAAMDKFKTDPYLISCVPLRAAHNEANNITQVM
jgi:hypothetical protein